MSDTSSLELENRFITVTLSPPQSNFELFFDQMVATEELGRPFLYELLLISGTQKLDLTALLGTAMTIAIQLPTEGQFRYFNGIVTRMSYVGLEEGFHRYRAELRPWIWLLTRKYDCAIYQNKSILDIIKQVFKDNGFSDVSDSQIKNTSNYFTLEYCVQYRESTFDFVTRLMEEAGIYYYFTHTSTTHTLVLADDPSSHSPPDGLSTIEFHAEEREFRRKDDHIWDWRADLSLQSGQYTLTDYHFITPASDLSAKSIFSSTHPYSTYEVFDYPGDYTVAANGQIVAATRMQELTARVEVLEGTGNVRLLCVGNTFTLSGFEDTTQNRAYLVRGAVTTLKMQEGWFRAGAERGDTFLCQFKAIPATVPYRLPRVTRRPLVTGPQPAKVVGASGDEITTDQYGRIKVKFYWDRSDAQDETASCWIRVSQPWAGVGWGGMVIPRVGQEVIVEFLEGDPDRPIVTGRVYNATATVPYTLPDNKTMSTLKSNSSTGGNGFNELRFEDKAGSEEIFIHAQKDMNTIVLNNQTGTITQNSDYVVQKGTMSTTVQESNMFLTVTKGTLTETIYGDMSTTIQNGNQTLTVSTGNLATTVSSGDVTFAVSQGKLTETIHGDHSTTLDQGSRTLTVSQGDMTTSVSAGSMTTTVKNATKLTVSSGDYSVNITAGNATVQAGQSITLQVGSNSIKIDATGVTVTGAKIGLSATGELQMQASGVATLQGSMVNIN